MQGQLNWVIDPREVGRTSFSIKPETVNTGNALGAGNSVLKDDYQGNVVSSRYR